MRWSTRLTGLVLVLAPLTLLADENKTVNKKSVPAAVIAQEATADGKTISYKKTEADIGRLISSLKKAGVTEERLLNSKFWLSDNPCRMQEGSCSGDCSEGSCQKVFNGHYTYCSCVK